jgi:hypothetical protein
LTLGRSADIRSPESLQRFRHRYLEFDKSAHRAVELILGDLRSVSEWLHREQLPYWKLQLRRRHDHMKDMWREYIMARHGDRRMGKPSCVDERKAYEKAKRMKEEAELKIQVVEKWKMTLDMEIEKLVPPTRRFQALLDELTPKAVARLDHMLDRLEEYLRPSSAGAARAAKKPAKKEGGDA